MAAKYSLIVILVLSILIIFNTSIFIKAGEVVSVLVSGATKLNPIYAVDTEEKKIAFSFDATWGNTRTPLILQILADNNIRTTFFLTNIWINSYPQLAREIADRGHETGLHSANHPELTKLPIERVRQELLDNSKMIEDITGQKPVLFRPPFGAYNNNVINVAKEEGLVPIQWSVDSLDWKNLSSEAIFKRVTEKIKPGAIVLFHNDGTNTPQSLQPIINYLRNENYEIVPISELIYKDNFFIDINGIQKQRKENIN